MDIDTQNKIKNLEMNKLSFGKYKNNSYSILLQDSTSSIHQ
jgi:hypothetical protein